MPEVALRSETDWDGWRTATRALVLADVPPEAVRFVIDPANVTPPPTAAGAFAVPRTLVALAAQAIQAREPDRFALLYRLVWRAHAGAPVLEDVADPDLRQARALALAVRAEAHRMRSLIRYLPAADGTRFLGWYAPAHFVLEANAQVLARWFPGFTVSILTPDGSAHWNPDGLRFGPAVDPAAIPDDAALRAYWAGFGAELLAVAAPGASLPEAETFEEARRPPDQPPLAPVVPGGTGAADAALAAAAREAATCRRCPLGAPATQTVFGEGPAGARMMFIGEQAGDQEDVIGRPFVGPAGQMLDRALEEAGHRPPLGLDQQRREAFQVRRARPAPAAPDAAGAGDRGLPVLARCGACAPAARPARGAGRHGRAHDPRSCRDDRARTRPADPAVRWRNGVGDRASLVPAAAAGRSGADAGIRGLRRRSAHRGRAGRRRPGLTSEARGLRPGHTRRAARRAITQPGPHRT